MKPSHQVGYVKAVIEREMGILTDQQRLVFSDKNLQDDEKLAHYNIQHLDTVHLHIHIGTIPIFIKAGPKNTSE